MILVYYLILINVAAFTLYGLDKSFAMKHKWRISEAMLILVACLGGAPGAGLGMLAFHHKTKKKKFRSHRCDIMRVDKCGKRFMGKRGGKL